MLVAGGRDERPLLERVVRAGGLDGLDSLLEPAPPITLRAGDALLLFGRVRTVERACPRSVRRLAPRLLVLEVARAAGRTEPDSSELLRRVAPRRLAPLRKLSSVRTALRVEPVARLLREPRSTGSARRVKKVFFVAGESSFLATRVETSGSSPRCPDRQPRSRAAPIRVGRRN